MFVRVVTIFTIWWGYGGVRRGTQWGTTCGSPKYKILNILTVRDTATASYFLLILSVTRLISAMIEGFSECSA